MTPAPEPVFFDPATVPTFSLHAAGGALLVALPPTVGFPDELGEPDPYEWDRPPGSSAGWFALGDGLPRQRPITTLAGAWLYDSIDAALVAINAIDTAVKVAAELHWCGKKIADLNALRPGSYRWHYQDTAQHVRHRLVLNTGKALTPGDLQVVVGNTGSPPVSLPAAAVWRVFTDA